MRGRARSERDWGSRGLPDGRGLSERGCGRAGALSRGRLQGRSAGLSGPPRLLERLRGHLSWQLRGTPEKPQGSVLQPSPGVSASRSPASCWVWRWVLDTGCSWAGRRAALTPRPCGCGLGAPQDWELGLGLAAACSWHCGLPSLWLRAKARPAPRRIFLPRAMQEDHQCHLLVWGRAGKVLGAATFLRKGTRWLAVLLKCQERCLQEGRLPVADGQWPSHRILRNPGTSSGLDGKQAARTARRRGPAGEIPP